MESFAIPEYQTPEFFLTLDEISKPLAEIITNIRNNKREPTSEESKEFTDLLDQFIEHVLTSKGLETIPRGLN